jgi:hypothetical protein
VEPISKKEKKPVQTAEKQTSDQSSSEVLPQEPSKEATAEAVPQEFTLIEVPKLSKEQIEAAKAFNFPIDKLFEGLNKINAYALSVETRFGIIEKNLADAPQKVVEALKAEAMKRQTEMAQQIQKGGEGEAKAGGGGLGSLLGLAKELGITGGGGGGMDEEMLKLTKEMMHMNIDRMRQDMGFTDAIKNAIVTKIASKAVTEII